MRKQWKNCLTMAMVLSVLTAGVFAGDIVPLYDDNDAVLDIDLAQKGTPGEITPIDTGGELTLAARFTAAEADLTATGPVIIIECGGTTFGNGLYLAGGDLIFATKGSNGLGGNTTTQTSLNDTDVSDSAAAVTIGAVSAGIETEVYVSYNTNTGQVIGSINGAVRSFTITGSDGGANLSGDESCSFLGYLDITPGQLGGLTNTNQGQGALWDANQAVNFTGTTQTNVRGQIFAATINPVLLPNDPDPANGAVNVDPDTVSQLMFDTAEDPNNLGSQNPQVTGHFVRVYDSFEGDPNFDVILESTFVAAGTDPISVNYDFELDQIVYWQVEEQINGNAEGDPENIVGPVWRFDALKSVPVIDGDPENSLVAPGEAASLTVSASSVSGGLSYQWYKSDDDTNNTKGDDTAIDGATSDTLTIASAALSDEGYYYCAVSNTAGTVDTGVAAVGIKRLVALYTLDESDFDGTYYLDTSTEDPCAHNLVPNAVPASAAWVDGADPSETGDGLDIGLNGETAAASEFDFAAAEFTDELTISLWVKWGGTDPESGTWQGLCSSSGPNNWFFEINNNTGVVQANAPGFSPFNTGTNVVPVDDWTHVVLTSKADQTGTIYINGVEAGSSVNYSINQNVTPVYLGANNFNVDGFVDPLNGALDDVRIYNYALDKVAVAQLYYDVLETAVCINPNDVNMSFDVAGGGENGDEPDCRVDLIDFEVMASTWLNCAIYPQSECQ